MARNTRQLEVRDLVVRYGRLTAVESVSFTAKPGQVELLLGANGAGKSSVLKAVAGVVRPAGGQVVVGDDDITGKPAWRVVRSKVVLVPEGRRIVQSLTVEENLLLGGYSNTSTSSRTEILADVLDLFPILGERRRSPGGYLSGGEQQMLAFGRALMADPDVILMDEPSMGLAPVMVDKVFQTVLQIAQRGIAVVMVEQNAAAMELASGVHVLEQGREVLGGTGAELRSDPRVANAFLGVSDSSTAATVGDLPS